MKKMKKETVKKLFGISVGVWLFNLFLVAGAHISSIPMWLSWGAMVYLYMINLRNE